MPDSAALVGNGAIHDYSLIASLINDYDLCIAVDGGLIHCQALKIVPDLIIGDFDSISPEILKLYPQIPQEIFPIDKDQTDMELAIDKVKALHVKKIGIFGAMEKRTDHALSNLHLMQRDPDKIVIETERETIFSVDGHRKIACRPGQLISLIPISSPALGVTTQGLKWELKDATFDKNFYSISNICTGSSFEISIGQGNLICCILR